MKIAVSITLFLALFFSDASAQVTRPPVYDTCNYLRPLEGEWMSVNGTDTIKVYLRFHRNFYSDPQTYNSTMDQLWGWMEYKQGSSIVMSDYANRFATLPYNLDDLTAGLRSVVLMAGKAPGVIRTVNYTGCQNPVIELGGGIRDMAKCRANKTVMATVNGAGSGAQMTWMVVQPGGFVEPGCEGVTLPETFVLVKQ